MARLSGAFLAPEASAARHQPLKLVSVRVFLNVFFFCVVCVCVCFFVFCRCVTVCVCVTHGQMEGECQRSDFIVWSIDEYILVCAVLQVNCHIFK